MKKIALVLFLSFLIIPFVVGNAAAIQWKLYDNFNSYMTIGDLNPTKWTIDNVPAAISIENGQVRFDHPINSPGDSSWLQLIKKPRKIKGIRTKVRVTAWDGEVRARIGREGDYDPDNGYVVWEQFQIKYRGMDIPSIAGGAVALDKDNSYEWKYDYVFSEFGFNVVPVLDETYTLTMIFSRTKIIFIVKGDTNGKWGKSTYYFPKKLDADDTYFKGIGTRSDDNAGSCTVYFDDVYVDRP